MAMIDSQKAKSVLSKYQSDPIKFFVDCLDVKKENVWHKMVELAEAVRDNQRTAAKAGHSVSKTYTSARIALWFLYCFYPSTVITTAPSYPQVSELLWREIRQAHANAKIPLGGEPTKTMLDLQSKEGGEKWFAYGFATRPDTAADEATRVQGYHNVNVLVIFDEAAGILKQIWDAVESLITSERHKLLVLGNPTTPNGNFPDCFKDPDYKKITISCLDTPNYKEGREVIPGLAGKNFVARIIKKFGEHSSRYKGRVLGEIPDEDVDAIVPLAWYERAIGRKHYSCGWDRKYIVVDVADGGADATVITLWHDKELKKIIPLYEKKVEEVEPYVWRALKEIGGNSIVIDNDGIGRVLIGLLNASKPDNVDIIPFRGSDEAVKDSESFKHVRSEALWMMREDFKESKITVPNDDDLKTDVINYKWDNETPTAKKGFITAEAKKTMKERIGRSPDFGDCVMMMSWCFSDIRTIEKKDPYRQSSDVGYELTPETV